MSRAVKRQALGPLLAPVLAPVRQRLGALQQGFNQRQPRERVLMIAVALMLVLALADRLLIEPALKNLQAARAQARLALSQREALQTDALKLGNAASTQVQLQRAELAAWRQRTQAGETLLRSHEDALIGPEQMLNLLEQVLARHGQVRVRTLRSLERVDLLAARPTTSALPAGNGADTAPSAAAAAIAAAAAAAGASGAPAAPGAYGAAGAANPSLYRHGVELVLEGGFSDLLGYLQSLEAMPQHVLWGGMSLKVQQHPTALLTLRLYTVSRDRHWLEI